MKADGETLDLRVAEKDSKIVQLNQALRTLDEVSARTTSETVEVAKYLQKLLLDIEATQRRVDGLNNGILGMKRQLNRLNAEIAALQAAIEENNRFVQTSEADTQTDLLVVNKRSSAISDAWRRLEQETMMKNRPFACIFTPDSKEIQIPEGGIVLNAYNDFAALRYVILANAHMFQLTADEIMYAEAGDFDLEDAPTNFLRLFSSKLVSDSINRAIRACPHTDVET
jgi:hypothetical protein